MTRSGWRTGLRGPNARSGLGLVLLYVAVAVVTQRLQPDGFRPLFDGFAPPLPYRWVKPPPELVNVNLPAFSAERDVPLGEAGSEVSNATTDDSQASAQLEAGSVPPNPPDTAVRLTVTPMDPSLLGALAPGVRAVSNVYHVSLGYQPSGMPVAALAKPGTIALTASTTGDRLLFSADGASWQEKPSRPYGNTGGRFASLDAPGYYLVAGHSTRGAAEAEQDDGASRPNWFLLSLVGILPVVGALLVLRPAPPLPVAARRRPPQKKRRRKKRP